MDQTEAPTMAQAGDEPEIQNSQSEAQAVAQIIKDYFQPHKLALSRGARDEAEVLLLPNGLRAQSIKPLLDEYLTAPERRKGTAQFTELASFIAHVKRFADEHTVIFANRNPEEPELVAVLDYHQKGANGEPRFGEHRARYGFPVSDEWQAWRGADGRWMTQQDFAEFVEDRIADVVSPENPGQKAKEFAASLGVQFATPAKLMDLSRKLTVRLGGRVTNQVNLSSGEAQLVYEQTHQTEAGEPLKVPGAFLLAVPVFRNGAPYQIAARLRYRVQGGSVSWSFALWRIDRIFDHAIGEACETAERETALPLLFGTPEA